MPETTVEGLLVPVAMPCACIVAHFSLDDVILALHIQA